MIHKQTLSKCNGHTYNDAYFTHEHTERHGVPNRQISLPSVANLFINN